MINKQSLWFLTLFSLILVLSVYYITMPQDLFYSNHGISPVGEEEEVVEIEESEIITALKLDSRDQKLELLADFELILTSLDTSLEEKNAAYEKIKALNQEIGLEEKLEEKLKEEYKKQTFVKLNGTEIRIVMASKDHNFHIANNIMRSVQKEFPRKMYISVEFQPE
ncbi:MAG TPA: hypothetical protein GX690_00850 [Tenericutes bacterium]|jgi:stage III sporulation protein AH|nr:hypothetical protein [Mycoplasmatota bacterium]